MDNLEIVAFRKVSGLYKILYNPLSLSIVQLLTAQKELKVSDIHQQLSLSQSQVSQQLSKLRRIRLLLTRREKNVIYYRINEPRFNDIKSFALQFYKNGL